MVVVVVRSKGLTFGSLLLEVSARPAITVLFPEVSAAAAMAVLLPAAGSMLVFLAWRPR